jgi:hypothetical protein
VAKRRHSAFYGTELEIILRRLKADTIIVAGVTAPICCESTVRDAAFRDLQVIYPADLNECNDLVAPDGSIVAREDVLRVVNAIIGFLYGRVTSSDALVREIAARAELRQPARLRRETAACRQDLDDRKAPVLCSFEHKTILFRQLEQGHLSVDP